MIDEELTFEKYGYYSMDLTPKSNKYVVAVCDGCGAIRYQKKSDYRDLCRSCAQSIRHHVFPHTHESRRKQSATQQGISYEDWDGFVRNSAYCKLFDEACRERIRDKYNRMCFLCSKHEFEETRKLSVHHVDMNKMQGCDGIAWKLVPLCRSCHATAHFDPLKSRIEYILA